MARLSLCVLWGMMLFTLSLAIPNPPASSKLYHRQRALSSSAAPLPPSQDPWYSAPEDYATAEPGVVLKIRTAPGNLSAVVGASAAYNVLYRTTDAYARPTWAVTTLYVPYWSHNTSIIGDSNYLLSYQYPYDSVNVDESPSYTFYTDAPADITIGLARGWYVSVPDYEGPLASYLLGVHSGQATLDSIRAVLSSGLGLDVDTRYVLWGYSGGAIASEWAAELQADYAPELNISGMALGGVPPNISASITIDNGGIYARLLPEGLLGMTTQDSDARDFLVSELKTTGPYNATTFLSVQNLTSDEAQPIFTYQDIAEYFIHGMDSIYAPIMQQIYETQGLMGTHGVPQMPLYIYQAINDEVSYINMTDNLVNKFCDAGADILFERNTIGGHVAEFYNGDARGWSWLASVLHGTYSNEGCVIKNVTVGLITSPL